MNRFIGTVIITLFLSFFVGQAASGDSIAVAEDQVINTPPIIGMDMQDSSFTKLEIIPRYTSFRLQPGESEEMTVILKNKEDNVLSVEPIVVIQPYDEYLMDMNWITITPASKEIQAGGSEKFTIKMVIPSDASVGYYNPLIVFTDEVFPTPYPLSVPNYVHSMSLSIDVWKPPTVQIQNQYISGQVEGGKDYNYKIKLKNIGTEIIPIYPKIAEDEIFYGPYGSGQAFTNDAITISAPKEIAAGASAEVNVNVKVPVGSKGIYRGAIDLGIRDTSMRDPYMYRVQMELWVWMQPTESYIKTLTIKEATPLLIEVSSNIGGYLYPPWQEKKKDPSFLVTLTGADNKEIQLKKIKTIIKGGASLGGVM